MSPRVLILRAPGTNCDQESAHAFALAGGKPDIVHLGRLLESPKLADAYQVLCIPGGFSYGDDLGAGRIFGSQLQHRAIESLARFKHDGKLILGICNGFQILTKSGLLLADDPSAGPAATLTWNAGGKFEDRWVHLATSGNKSPFLAGIEHMYLPIAHAEGKFVARDNETLLALAKNAQLALRYVADADGAGSDSLLSFPANPNGSQFNVAGVCDETGRVLGLMPHPERFVDPTQHPRWTRGEAGQHGDGLRLFQNAVRYFR
jgi:phosphoribosylformylglycinamidine synthase